MRSKNLSSALSGLALVFVGIVSTISMLGQTSEGQTSEGQSVGTEVRQPVTEIGNLDIRGGDKIYTAQCANCHGANGQGNADEFADPLRGDLTLDQLTELIEKTMPETDPELCVGDDAKQVARFVYESYYSSAAQLRANRPRIELSRLTVRQYRESIADVIGSFGGVAWIPPERGIEGKYFASRNPTPHRLLSKQIDATIDFGEGVPYFEPAGKYESLVAKQPEKKPANKMNDGFSAHWNGGLIAPVTGMYEIVVESKNGFDLYINDLDRPLIDRRVRSDDVLEHRATVYLLGGRMVSLRLKMFSYPDPPAQIRLLWRPPHQPLVVIPQSALTQHATAEVIAVSTEFPADDASSGYERGTSVSAQWDAATTDAAIEVANWVSERIWKLAKAKPTDDDATIKVQQFCHQFVERAFVSPLDDRDRRQFVDQHFEQELSNRDRVKRVVIMTLKSPRFLYPTIQARDPDHELAKRMALSLWDSSPDSQLLKLAAQGKLSDEKKSRGELERMVNDPRSQQKLRKFFDYWLPANVMNISKDKEMFPGFDSQFVADLRTSLQLYLDDVVWSDDSDFHQLFLADYLYANRRLAEFYGLDWQAKHENQLEKNQATDDPADGSAGFQKIQVDPQRRAGMLTHPYLMTELAYYKSSSPIHRGVFVAKRLLGRQLRQPPSDVEPLTEEFEPEMTTRQRVAHQTQEAACMHCHTVINPLGFSLENYDAVGRFRETEKDRPIDVATLYHPPGGNPVELNGARDLANFLANDQRVQRTFVRQLFNYYAKQPVEAYGPDVLDGLQSHFEQHNFNIKQLLKQIVLVIVNHDPKHS